MSTIRTTAVTIGLAMFLLGGYAWTQALTDEAQSGNLAAASLTTLAGAVVTVVALLPWLKR